MLEKGSTPLIGLETWNSSPPVLGEVFRSQWVEKQGTVAIQGDGLPTNMVQMARQEAGQGHVVCLLTAPGWSTLGLSRVPLQGFLVLGFGVFPSDWTEILVQVFLFTNILRTNKPVPR